RTFYGSLGQCQGFAAPRKNRAPLTPPQPSTKSYREESEGKEQRTGAPGLRTTGCGFTPRPILETLTPAGISLLRAKNGLDKGVHLTRHVNLLANPLGWRMVKEIIECRDTRGSGRSC